MVRTVFMVLYHIDLSRGPGVCCASTRPLCSLPSPAEISASLCSGLLTFLSFASVTLWGEVCFSGADAFGLCLAGAQPHSSSANLFNPIASWLQSLLHPLFGAQVSQGFLLCGRIERSSQGALLSGSPSVLYRPFRWLSHSRSPGPHILEHTCP